MTSDLDSERYSHRRKRENGSHRRSETEHESRENEFRGHRDKEHDRTEFNDQSRGPSQRETRMLYTNESDELDHKNRRREKQTNESDRDKATGDRRSRSPERRCRRSTKEAGTRGGSGERRSHRPERLRDSPDTGRSRSPDREARRSKKHMLSRNKEVSVPERTHRDAVPFRKGVPLPTQEDSFAVSKGEEPEKPKEKPNYGNSGLLASASNAITQVDGSTITLKYHEPPEARKPPAKDDWKLFVFKDSEIVDTIDLSARSCWLIGREIAVVDLLAEHPSISKQHAVVQFRYTEKKDKFGDRVGKVKPYLIDLESGNGTRLNQEKVPESRFLELRHKDMMQFGSSTREYVLMLAPRT